MTWFKLDDNFPRHPKVVRAGTDAAWLFVAGGCYCAQYLTDGIIPKDALVGLTALKQPAKLAVRLVEAGLWHDHGDEYEVHGYLDYNPSREHVEDERRKAQERRANGGRTSRERRPTEMRETTAPVPTRPDPFPPKPSQSIASRAPNPHFDALVELFGKASTKERASFYGQTVKSLKEIPAEPQEVLERGKIMLAKGWTDCSPMALLKHWDALAPNASNGNGRDFDALT